MAKPFHKHIHSRILIQVAVIFVVAIGLAAAVVYDSIQGNVGFIWIAIAAIVGLGVGYIAGRMFLLTWHEDTQKVVMKMDRLGFILIAAYVAFRILGAQLLGDYWSGTALSAISFAVLDGILVGRLVSIWRRVSIILREQGVIT